MHDENTHKSIYFDIRRLLGDRTNHEMIKLNHEMKYYIIIA